MCTHQLQIKPILSVVKNMATYLNIKQKKCIHNRVVDNVKVKAMKNIMDVE